jgi:hypothetical protein
LGAVVEVLAGRGNAVEVVSGIEQNALPWDQVVKRHGPNAVYVVCGDDALSLDKIAGIRASLQRANVPFAQIWAGPINWQEPVQVLRHADQLLRTANGEPVRSASEASGRTVLPPPVPPAPPQRTMPAPMVQNPPPPRDEIPDISISPQSDYKRPAIIGGIALALTVALVTALAWPSDDDEAEVDEVAVANADVTSVDTPEPDKKAEVAPAPARKAQEEPEPASEQAPPEEEVEVPAEPAAEVDLDVAAETPSLLSGTERKQIDDALRNQQIRALDILLISAEAMVHKRKRMRTAWNRFPEAEQYCDQLVVDGVAGWRLPSAGELASITTANMLKRSTYWSSTKGDSYGNTRIVWGVYRKKMRGAGQRFRGARTVCVRDGV